MDRIPFSVRTPSGELVGSVTGQGPRVLAVHGGPGMSGDYPDPVIAALAGSYEVATFQQRGLAPSTREGLFTVAEALADLAAVLDSLDWQRALLMGHSWGGHLALHAAAAMPERLTGVLAVDPLGAVGDGGGAQFEAEMLARMPAADQTRVQVLDAKEEAGALTAEDDLEALSLYWPSYFAVPVEAPPMPPVALSQAAYQGLMADLTARLPSLESSLPSITVPVGVLVGASSPMPPSAGIDTAERIPGAWWHVEPGAGHFPWHEAPGCLLAALDRLAGRSPVRADP